MTQLHIRRPRAKGPARLAAAAAVVAAGIGFAVAQPYQADAAGVTAGIDKGTLVVKGTGADDVITIRLDPNDPTTLHVDAGGDSQAEFTFKVADVQAIAVFAKDGNDVVAIDQTYGVISIPATFDGGTGYDNLSGGSGDDRMTWKNGDGTDRLEGGDGTDTVEVNGSSSAETFTTTANGTRVRFDRISPEPFFLDIGTTEQLVLNAGGGADSVSATGNLAALIALTVDGGAGNDTILGSNGVDVLMGGAGSDLIDGQQANDAVFGGGGNDTFQWDPGDGSDVLEGQGGSDTMAFNGSGANETYAISPNGSRVRLTRDIGSIVMDIGGVEAVALKTLGGTDMVTVNPMTGTGLSRVNVDVATFSGTGDALPDTVYVVGTNGNDVFRATRTADSANPVMTGMGTTVTLIGGEALDSLQASGQAGDDLLIVNDNAGLNAPVGLDGGDDNDTVQVNGGSMSEVFTATANGTRVRFDRIDPAPYAVNIGTVENLVVKGNGGDDSFSATGNLAALIGITVDGGAGNDTILGSNGVDVLIGGGGDDFIDGQQANDAVFGGAGNDTFQWDPGDGSDVLEGQGGLDRMLFNGSNGGEMFDISANGGRVRFTRSLGAIVMDLDNIESIDLNTFGNVDSVVVRDLAGTDVKEVNINLAAFGGIGDAQLDDVILIGTSGKNVVQVAGDGSAASVTGLAATVNISGAEPANDRLTVNGLAGNDVIDASALTAGAIQFAANGGEGNDVLTGGAGNDTLLGEDGDDVLTGGPGLDVLDGGAGNNTVTQD